MKDCQYSNTPTLHYSITPRVMTELDLQRLLRMIEEAIGMEKKDSENIISYFQECYQLGVEILPLDINQSQITCSVENMWKQHFHYTFPELNPKPALYREGAKKDGQGGGQKRLEAYWSTSRTFSRATQPMRFAANCSKRRVWDEF